MSNEITMKVATVEHIDRAITDQVRDRLALCDELEKSLSELTHRLEHAANVEGELRAKVRSLESLELRSDQLDQREATLDKREENIALNEKFTEFKIKAAEQRTDDHKAMVSLIFRNSELRKLRMFDSFRDAGDSTSYSTDGASFAVSMGEVREAMQETTVESQE